MDFSDDILRVHCKNAEQRDLIVRILSRAVADENIEHDKYDGPSVYSLFLGAEHFDDINPERCFVWGLETDHCDVLFNLRNNYTVGPASRVST